MQIPHREPLEDDRERLVVVPDTLDDLWHLHHIIEPGDRVAGDTHRRIQRADDTLRSTGGEREHMHVTLLVDAVEFHKFANRLRVSGEITDASREDQIGFHHTLNVEIHDEVTIEKVLQPDQRQRLEEAIEATEDPDVAIATVEEGRATVHSVSQYGTEETATISGPTGKGEYARSRSELFAELSRVLARLSVERIVLAGPGFTKQDAYRYLEEEEPEVAERTRVVDTSSAGGRGVHEVLERGVLEEVKAAARIGQEAEQIDELRRRIGQDEPATYGLTEVNRATEYGAVDVLLVLDTFLREERQAMEETAVDINALIRSVEHQGGDVVVFSSEHEPGQQLEHLGGIAALLRYQIE